MPLSISKGGLDVALKVLGFIWIQVKPWLKEQAAKSETPIDEWMIDLVDKVLGTTS